MVDIHSDTQIRNLLYVCWDYLVRSNVLISYKSECSKCGNEYKIGYFGAKDSNELFFDRTSRILEESLFSTNISFILVPT
jgi:hypothetical protein